MTRPARLVHDPEGLNTACWPVGGEELVTPTDRFFTRSHAPTPSLDARSWRLEIDGLVKRRASLSLGDLLQEFPRRTVTATLVCAGLRREDFVAFGPLPGELPWGPEAISTGRWSGVPLRCVLERVGVQDGARHVQFVGLDTVERQGQCFGFGGSIELDKALSDEVLLATELNDAPLPPAHGAPLRVVVPGWIGARSVKWLGHITLAQEPSENYFQRRAYRLQREANPRDPRDVTAGVALTEIPLNSAIAEPAPGAVVAAGRVEVHGWAIGTGGCGLARVEVSADGGRHWVAAQLAPAGDWSWSLWRAAVTLAAGRHMLVVRATDSGGAVQPVSAWETWNVKGYNNNAWHSVTVRAE